MKRRDFIALAGAAAVFPRLAFAQQAKVPRIAFLSIPVTPQFYDAFNQGLADFGYFDGKNITVDYFTAPTTNDILAFAAKAVASKPDIIWTSGTTTAQAVQRLTTTIPVVFYLNDPLSAGLVQSLAHPGGNLTGVTLLAPDLVGKELAILKEVVPAMTAVVVLNLPANAAASVPIMDQVRIAAKALAIEPVVVDFVEGKNFSTQFDQVVSTQTQAAYVPSLQYFTDNRDPDVRPARPVGFLR